MNKKYKLKQHIIFFYNEMRRCENLLHEYFNNSFIIVPLTEKLEKEERLQRLKDAELIKQYLEVMNSLIERIDLAYEKDLTYSKILTKEMLLEVYTECKKSLHSVSKDLFLYIQKEDYRTARRLYCHVDLIIRDNRYF